MNLQALLWMDLQENPVALKYGERAAYTPKQCYGEGHNSVATPTTGKKNNFTGSRHGGGQ